MAGDLATNQGVVGSNPAGRAKLSMGYVKRGPSFWTGDTPVTRGKRSPKRSGSFPFGRLAAIGLGKSTSSDASPAAP
jgi:hypothetical protein